MADLLAKQHKCLVAFISEAGQNEEVRIARLQRATKASEKKELLNRFENERNRDKQKIGILTEDLKQLAKVHKEGGLEGFKTARREFREQMSSSGKAPPSEVAKPNRFAGLEEFDQKLFHADIINKFDRDRMNFENRAVKNLFNPRQEYAELKLLTQKKDLIKQLIAVQSAPEMGGIGFARGRAGSSRGGSSTGYGGPTTYNTGGFDSVSSISMATFTSPTPRGMRQQRMPSSHGVPRLKLM